MNRLFDLLQSGGRPQVAPAIQSNTPITPEAAPPSAASGPSSLYNLLAFGAKRHEPDDLEKAPEELKKVFQDSEGAKKFKIPGVTNES